MIVAMSYITSAATLVFSFNMIFLITAIVIGWLFYGITMIVNHRYAAHSVFKPKSAVHEYVMYFLATLAASGSPFSWAYAHRVHHTSLDTGADPQSIYTVGFIKTWFAWGQVPGRFRVRLVKDLLANKGLMLFHKSYHAMLAMYMIVLLALSPTLFGYVFGISVTISYILLGILNTAGHAFNGPGQVNNLKIPFIFFGEEQHARHHNNYTMYYSNNKYDIAGYIIKYMLANKTSLLERPHETKISNSN